MIRKATEKDVQKIIDLLYQVNLVHKNARPDIFKMGTKYDKNQLINLLSDETRPILVSENDNGEVDGYCFCVFVRHVANSIFNDVKTLHIDDLCVDEDRRGNYIGKQLFNFAKDLAKQNGCYNLTLNVWTCNPSAIKFYESCGLSPQKIGMELIL